MTRKKMFFFAPLAIAGIAILIAIGGAIVMALWNALLPPLFGWREIGFWQALGILVLARILVGGHGIRGPRGPGFRRRSADQMADRWASMTAEERQRFRERVRARCGFAPDLSPEAPREPSPPEHSV